MLGRSGGLPKKTETYFFFQIDSVRVHEFRTQLAKLVPHITSTAQALSDRQKIAQNKKDAAEKKDVPEDLKMTGLNLSFTQKGLTQVSSTV